VNHLPHRTEAEYSENAPTLVVSPLVERAPFTSI